MWRKSKKWQGCSTPKKIKYSTREDAQEAAGFTKKVKQIPVSIYLCKCGFWHLSKRRKS